MHSPSKLTSGKKSHLASPLGLELPQFQHSVNCSSMASPHRHSQPVVMQSDCGEPRPYSPANSLARCKRSSSNTQTDGRVSILNKLPPCKGTKLSPLTTAAIPSCSRSCFNICASTAFAATYSFVRDDITSASLPPIQLSCNSLDITIPSRIKRLRGPSPEQVHDHSKFA